MLAVSNFLKSYGEETILQLKSLNLDVGSYVIHGENGSGKTTFFKCLAGMAPCQGTISIEGVVLAQNPVAYRRRVNFAEAEPLYPAYLTARDLVHFVGKTRGASAGQADHYIDELGIREFYTKACGTYSSGMLKKLSLALAFLGKPRLIILDEPLITLDQSTRARLLAIIREKQDVLFLLSSHQAFGDGLPNIKGNYQIQNKALVESPSN